MNFTKRAIAMAVLSTASLSSAAASVDIYGKANLTVQSSDEGDGSFTEVKSNASRIGLKGDHDLGNGYVVVYKAEFQVDMDGDSDKGDSITDRNQYLGVKGFFGGIFLGKNDTAIKQLQGNVDLFNDLNGDIKKLWKGENRTSDSITYKSPVYSGFQLAATYIAEDSTEGESGVSAGVRYGDKNLKKSKIYAAVAMESEVKGYDVFRATFSSKLAGVTLGFTGHTQENVDTNQEADGYFFSASYPVNNVTYKGQVQTISYDDGGDDRTGYSIGADYKLAQNAKLFTFYTTFDMDSQEDEDYLAVGLEYKF